MSMTNSAQLEMKPGDKTFKFLPFQSEFILSKTRFSAMIAGWGTGKTLCLLTKCWKYAQEHPGCTCLLVRKDFTDLQESTMVDFEKYFSVKVGSNKNYKLPNGSLIMFRHGSELEKLQNINLSFFGIEQAEEFDTDAEFTLLRGRIRQAKGAVGCAISNAKGHNWLWRMFIGGPDINRKRYHCVTAVSFDNPNLPEDFIEDLREMEREKPLFYRRFVMNSHEDDEGGDNVIPFGLITQAQKLDLEVIPHGTKIMGIDYARMGDDRTAFIMLQQCIKGWKVVFKETCRKMLMNEVLGKTQYLKRKLNPDYTVIDCVGMGAAPCDILAESDKSVIGFTANCADGFNKNEYKYLRDYAWFKTLELLENKELQLPVDEELAQDLYISRYTYKSNGQKTLLSKSQIKKGGAKSPDTADALIMAVHIIEQATLKDYTSQRKAFGERNGFFKPARGKGCAGGW